MDEIKRAGSFDMDGVIVNRIPLQFGAVVSKLLTPKSYNQPFNPKSPPITREDRENYDRPVLNGEKFLLRLHARRSPKKGIDQILYSTDFSAVFGNTGRPGSKLWRDMTYTQLRSTNIADKFEYVYFKPGKISSHESKYWALKELESLGYVFTHYDDNAQTVRLLAPHFPHSNFVIVQDLTSGILFSSREIEEYNNVKRISLNRNGVLRYFD